MPEGRRFGYTPYMGIWDRLGSVIKSYVNDYSEDVFRGRSPKSPNRHGDPDLNAAFEELDDYLNDKDKDSKWKGKKENSGEPKRPAVPKELYKDFEELGLGPEATFEECKAAYKKLLKIHHPDKHSGHPGNMEKATAKSARVNAAYSRLDNWFRLTEKKQPGS